MTFKRLTKRPPAHAVVDLTEEEKLDLTDALINEVYRIMYGVSLSKEDQLQAAPGLECVNWALVIRSARQTREVKQQTDDSMDMIFEMEE